MASTFSRVYALATALIAFGATCSARALWVPEVFDPQTDSLLQSRSSAATCGGASSLNQCPSPFPSSFCCSSGTVCLSINTGNASVSSAICCPAGQGCNRINPVSCQESLQDATRFPGSQLHSLPPQKLDTCGSGCCPMGYACRNAQCVAKLPLSTGTTTTIRPSTTSSTQPTATKTTTPAPAAADNHPPNGIAKASWGIHFSGRSFAAGFVPGIALGIIIAALIVLLCLRKKHKESKAYNEKHRDTLTDLGTLRPTMHGRSISEPTVDPILGTRTDFLRSTPPRTANSNGSMNHPNNVGAFGPETPAHRTPIVKALFSRSPFMNQTPSTPPLTQPPLPSHMQRGTLSFHISPIRGLKTKKSMHSLRRQMTDAGRQSTGMNRTESTEAINNPNNGPYTPDQRAMPEDNTTLSAARYEPPQSARTWETLNSPEVQRTGERVPYASSSRYPSTQPQMRIPTPPPPLPGQTNGGMGFLDSPYTPTKDQANGGGLTVPGSSADLRRETTFSTLMEKAGLRKSDLVMGTKQRIDAKYGL